jgi:hypothetical protein
MGKKNKTIWILTTMLLFCIVGVFGGTWSENVGGNPTHDGNLMCVAGVQQTYDFAGSVFENILLRSFETDMGSIFDYDYFIKDNISNYVVYDNKGNVAMTDIDFESLMDNMINNELSNGDKMQFGEGEFIINNCIDEVMLEFKTVKNLKLKGKGIDTIIHSVCQRETYPLGKIFNFENDADIEISDIFFKGNQSDDIYNNEQWKTGTHIYFYNVNNSIIENVHFDSGIYSIQNRGNSSNNIFRNIYHYNGEHVFAVEGYNTLIENVYATETNRENNSDGYLQTCIKVVGGNNLRINNLNCEKFYRDAVMIYEGENIYIKNSNFDGNVDYEYPYAFYGVTILEGNNIVIENTVIKDVEYGINVDPYGDVSNIYLRDSRLIRNLYGVFLQTPNELSTIDGLYIDNTKITGKDIYDTSAYGLRVDVGNHTRNIYIRNSELIPDDWAPDWFTAVRLNGKVENLNFINSIISGAEGCDDIYIQNGNITATMINTHLVNNDFNTGADFSQSIWNWRNYDMNTYGDINNPSYYPKYIRDSNGVQWSCAVSVLGVYECS